MNQLSSGECRLAKDHDDVAMDLFSLQKQVQGGTLIFSEAQNPLNSASHCDMAWSKALAAEADAGGGASFGFSKTARPVRERVRSLLGW
jgi:hypothetical protein